MKEGLDIIAILIVSVILILITIPLSISWQIGKLLGLRLFFTNVQEKGVIRNGKGKEK